VSIAIEKPAGAACASCPARAGKCVPPEAAASPHGPRLVVVGDAPSRAELEAGRPFAGQSGKMLQRGLRSLGLQRADVHWTNAILCECDPRDMPAARKACQARLTAELAEAVAASPAPHPVVMPVGAYALQGALNSKRKPQILKWRGTVTAARFQLPGALAAARLEDTLGAVPVGASRKPLPAASPETASAPAFVCPTIHPAYVMRAPAWAPILEIDVERVGRVMASGWQPPEEQAGREIVIARTVEDIGIYCDRLGPEVGFDVETVGLGPTHTRLVCFALSDGPLTVVVPWSKGRDGMVPWWPGASASKQAASIVSRCLAERVAVTHNGPGFDHIVAQRYGLRIARWDDTLLHAHATASHMPKRLAHCVTQSLDVAPWKELENRTATLDRLWGYNAQDTLYTILRWQAVRHEVAA
jgi:uracil-DNA glycosylase family 4